MAGPVIVIGLDAAEPWLIDHYIEKGRMPHLSRLRDEGAYGLVKNQPIYQAEPAFTTFMTGVWPRETGYWGRIEYHAEDLDVREYGTYKFDEFPMFWELGQDYKVCAFDQPQAEISGRLNGVEVVAWGAHSPRRGRGSAPESLYDQIVARHGPHPALNDDNKNLYIDTEVDQLKEELMIGAKRRTAATLDLLKSDRWDLFLTTYGEVHAVEHQYWHYTHEHPLHAYYGDQGRDDIGDLLEYVDHAIAEIEDAAGPDATLVVYSAHGMTANRSDLSSMLFLGEMLYRWNFDGEVAIAPGDTDTPVPEPRFDYLRHWKHEVWDMVTPDAKARLTSPRDQQAMGQSLNWQPVNWFKSIWPDMKAFALPSYSEGYVRLNVKGRDKGGLVEPADYNKTCDELEAMLGAWRCARTGKPLIEEFVRTRPEALMNDPKLPDADIVIRWGEGATTDVIEHPELGRIGPVPWFRTGSHTPNGFLIAKGPGIKAGSALPEGEAIDFATTIRGLVGAPKPDYLKGRDLFAS